MMSLSVNLVYVGCILMMVSLPPLCRGGFGKVPPRPPSIRTTDSLRHSEAILYRCIQTQQCKCKQYHRFQTCWDKLPDRLQIYSIDKINSCGMDPQIELGPVKSWTDKLCPLSTNITKACYDKISLDMMRVVRDASLGMRSPEEAHQIEEVRRCAEPTLAFCSEFPDECAS